MKLQDKEQKKDLVILFGEEHTDGSHMPHVTELVKDLLKNYSQVTVALEQSFSFKKTAEELCAPPKLSLRQQKILEKKGPVNHVAKNVDNFVGTMVFQDSYTQGEFFRSIYNFANHAQQIKKAVDFFRY